MYAGDQRRHPSLGMARYWHESPWIIYEYVLFSLLVGHFVTDSTIVNHHLVGICLLFFSKHRVLNAKFCVMFS